MFRTEVHNGQHIPSPLPPFGLCSSVPILPHFLLVFLCQNGFRRVVRCLSTRKNLPLVLGLGWIGSNLSGPLTTRFAYFNGSSVPRDGRPHQFTSARFSPSSRVSPSPLPLAASARCRDLSAAPEALVGGPMSGLSVRMTRVAPCHMAFWRNKRENLLGRRIGDRHGSTVTFLFHLLRAVVP